MKKLICITIVVLLILALCNGCAKNEAKKMATLDDVADKRIGVYVGTIYDKFAVNRFPDATILRYNSISDFVLSLKNRKIDVAISNLYSAKNVMKTNPEIGILTDDLLSFPIGIGFNKKNPALRERFNVFLKQFKADGSFDTMYQKWFSGDPETVKMPKFEPNPAGEKIILGVSVGDLPNVGYIDGAYVGFDVELVQTFAQKEKLNLDIMTMEFGGLIAALAAGKVDMIADCIAINEERKAQIAFSDPYMEDKSALIALKENLANASPDKTGNITMAEIVQKKVGVLQGSVHDSYMAENYPDAQVLQFKSYSDLILAAKSGKVDAGFLTSPALKEYQKADPSLKLLLNDVFSVDIGMGFNKGNEQLKIKFNTFLKGIKTNGVYNDLIKRWYQDGSTEMPVIVNPKNNGKLIVGVVSDKGLPFAVMKNNRLIGFDIELAERFAAYLGKEIEYSDMEFGNLIAAALTKKIDMITSTLMITEERKKQIAFSDPYYNLTACVFGVKKVAEPAGASFLQNVAKSFYNNIILENRYVLIFDGLKTTALISIFAIFFGTLVGALICFLRMSQRKAINLLGRVYISLLRGLPVLVLLMLIFYVVFAKVNINPVLVAVIAFGMNFAAYVAEIFRSAITSIDKGQTEAGIAGGFTKAQTFIYIVMPQAVRQVLPVYKGELISLVKSTSIVGYIAVQDLTKASDIIRSRTFDAFFPLVMTAVLYFLICGLLLLILNAAERKTDPKRKRDSHGSKRMVRIVSLTLAVLVGLGLCIPAAIHRNAADNGPITTLAQLDKKRICVITGTTGDFAVRARYKKAQVMDMVYPADAVLAVQTKKTDAFVFDKSTLQYVIAKNKEKFTILPEKLAEVEIAIPMQKDAIVLHQKINAGITKLKNDGTLAKMYQKWFVQVNEKTPDMPDIALDGRNGTLRMGTCLIQEPFSFSSNGKMVGFDIELGYRLAEMLGVKLVITDMSYDAMMTGLQTKKIDLCIANYYKLKERESNVKFSVPYMKNEISALVRREK